eukprot:2306844-Pyramimonas_sp.AAC.1
MGVFHMSKRWVCRYYSDRAERHFLPPPTSLRVRWCAVLAYCVVVLVMVLDSMVWHATVVHDM